jgi:myosin heavy subunit
MKAQMNKVGKSGIVIIGLSLLSAGAIWTANHKNGQLKADLQAEKLKSERSLAEKLSYLKDLEKSKGQLASLESTNKSLNRLLEEKNKEIVKKENAIKSTPDASNANKLQKELDQLLKDRENFVQAQKTLNDELARLREENKSLMASNTSLSKDYADLQASFKVAQAFSPENLELSARRGKKERPTVIARRTRKLEVGFDVPASVAQSVRFVMRSPDGRVIDQKDSRISTIIKEDSGALYASLSPLSGMYESSKRVEMTYKPEKKLEKGTYVVQIFSGDTRIGSCRVLLR